MSTHTHTRTIPLILLKVIKYVKEKFIKESDLKTHDVYI